MHGPLGGGRPLGVGQHPEDRGLVRDEGADVLGMRRHQLERGDRAAAAPEQVDRAADRLDDPMQVISVLVGS